MPPRSAQPILDRVFIVAGMPRSGTTLLYHNMQRHPAAFTPVRKELDYYTLHYHRGSEWYAGFFAGMAPGQLGCDISPWYSLVPSVPARIHAEQPDAKVVIGVRDPVSFALSVYDQMHTAYWRPPPFAKFIESFLYERGDHFNVIELQGRSALPERLEEYRRLFGPNVLLYNFAHLQRDTIGVLRAVEAFVGLPPFFTPETAETGLVNASRRRTVKLLSYLAARETTAQFARAFVPRRAIDGVRGALSKLGRAESAGSRPSHAPELRELAERAFPGQRAYVEDLFANGNLMLGDGVRYEPDLPPLRV